MTSFLQIIDRIFADIDFIHFDAEIVDFHIENGPLKRAFSSEMIDFQIENEPLKRAFSLEMVDFQIKNEPLKRGFRLKWFIKLHVYFKLRFRNL